MRRLLAKYPGKGRLIFLLALCFGAGPSCVVRQSAHSPFEEEAASLARRLIHLKQPPLTITGILRGDDYSMLSYLHGMLVVTRDLKIEEFLRSFYTLSEEYQRRICHVFSEAFRDEYEKMKL